MTSPRIIWSGDRTLHIVVGSEDSDTVARRVARVDDALRSAARRSGRPIVDVTPGSASVQLTFRPGVLGAEDPDAVEGWIREAVAEACSDGAAGSPPREVVIPVCYGGDHGPDLAWLAARSGLTEQDVASLHASADHVVRFLGFAPGFAYIAGLPAALKSPRMESPRTRVPAGSVAVAGGRTGIYPAASPGGWRLIGATPLRMFDATRRPPALLRAGDRVRFEPITRERFAELSAEQRP